MPKIAILGVSFLRITANDTRKASAGVRGVPAPVASPLLSRGVPYVVGKIKVVVFAFVYATHDLYQPNTQSTSHKHYEKTLYTSLRKMPP